MCSTRWPTPRSGACLSWTGSSGWWASFRWGTSQPRTRRTRRTWGCRSAIFPRRPSRTDPANRRPAAPPRENRGANRADLRAIRAAVAGAQCRQRSVPLLHGGFGFADDPAAVHASLRRAGPENALHAGLTVGCRLGVAALGCVLGEAVAAAVVQPATAGLIVGGTGLLEAGGPVLLRLAAQAVGAIPLIALLRLRVSLVAGGPGRRSQDQDQRQGAEALQAIHIDPLG